MAHIPAAELLQSLRSPPPPFDAADAARVAEQVFGIDARITALGGERDRNFRLETEADTLTLKVGNRVEPDALLDLQCTALRHIARQDPSLPVPRLRAARDGADWARVAGPDGEHYAVRLLDYLPGQALGAAPDDPRLLRSLGGMLARLDRALRGLFHPAADHPLAWDLKRAAVLQELCGSISEAPRRDVVEAVFERFRSRVLPEIPGLRAQLIHNDVSYHNTVVHTRQPWKIAGIFDFGDMVHAPLVQELAVTAAEVPAGRGDPISHSSVIIAGYHEVAPLETGEIALLPDLVATRLALALVVDAWQERLDQREYLRGYDEHAWSMLVELDRHGAGATERMYRVACGIGCPVEPATSTPNASEPLRARREARLGAALELSYDRPLHLIRGEGVWLYDAAGRAYLDAYNNVPHVGHCHPRVVDAIARQAGTLNTNTRYLYEAIVEYAERLCATLPAELDTCMFVSSGSEANDLAWRIAKACSGHGGAIVIEDAYHGVTDAVACLSPYDVDKPAGLAAHVATIPAPDEYRGPWRRDVPDRGERYATAVDEAVHRLGIAGHAPAAFFIDTVLSSSGIFIPCPGYVADAFARIRAAGGLCVADEVQAGFGRTGDHMWGFQAGGVVPDIVTLGKPIANGHPMGAVVTRREIAERFSRVSDFFSTTGGNPVSCAAGLAVLEAMERERLMDNTRAVGADLFRRLNELKPHHALVGDVRGAGLFAGVELVRDRTTLEPASDETRTIVNRLRDSGVLIGRDGPHGNVLKIRPPIVFAASHVIQLIETLDRVLSRLQS